MIRSPHRTDGSRLRAALILVAACFFVASWVSVPAAAEAPPTALLAPAELAAPPAYLEADRGYAERWRAVRLGEAARESILRGDAPIALELFDGATVVAEPRRTIRNPSGSVSWIGEVRGSQPGPVVLVHREGVTIGSIRTGNALHMLTYAAAADRTLHVLYEVEESSPIYREAPPTEVNLPPEKLAIAAARQKRMVAGQLAQDDGSLHDLMVVYTPTAEAELGGTVPMENLIDLGVTELNMSYEASGVSHRARLVHTALTDYSEDGTLGDPRDLLQGKDDGVMDEVHGLRDRYAADQVLLILSSKNGGGCGR
ncbi:MAG: hypothetical protein MI919_01670, partial [Holophagales bacterium]|nr:hypothetical protein [Holophagales bacterium]